MKIDWNSRICFKNFNTINKRIVYIAAILDLIAITWFILMNFTDLIPHSLVSHLIPAILLLITLSCLAFVLICELNLQAVE